MIAHIMKGMGRKVGLTSTDGIYVDGRIVRKADASGPKSASMVLQNPTVDFAVFEVARGGILREGLGYERNDVAVVLNVQPDHLGLRGIDTVEQLADVKAVLVEAVPRDGHAVLNADDPLVREMRRRCSGQVVWFSMEEPGSEARELIEAHCRRGGKALVLNPSERGEMIVVKHGRREMQLAWTHLLPATFSGRARMNVQNALAAAAAAFAAAAPLHDIRQGLRTFSTNYYLAPGRLNEVDVNGVNVIVDYCHNAPGMKMLGDFVDRLGESLSHDLARPSRIGVIATAGDRRDEDMRELGQVAAHHFDVVIVREDDALRGRERGEVAAFVTEGVHAGMAEGARCKQSEEVLDEIGAVRHAMARANAGDLVVICVDKHAAVMAELEDWSQQAQAGAGASLSAPAADPDYVPAAPTPAS
jgi:cyanophycin synthetase